MMLSNEKSALGGKIKKGIIWLIIFVTVIIADSKAVQAANVCVGRCIDDASIKSLIKEGESCFENPPDEVINGCQSKQSCCVYEKDIHAFSVRVPDSDCSASGGYCADGCNVSENEWPVEGKKECEKKGGLCCVYDGAAKSPASSFSPPAAELQQKQITGNQGGAGVVAPLTIPNVGLPDPQGGIKQVLENLLRWGLGIIGVLALIGFVVSGIQYIVSTGSEDMMESAKRNMLFSTIGIVVVLASFVIIQAINYALEAKSLF